MIHWLTEDLVKCGHDVTLFACGASQTSAKLRPICRRNLIEAMGRGEAYVYDCYANAAFAEALHDAEQFDIIHCHLGYNQIPYSGLAKTPVVHTVHAGLSSPDELWVVNRYPEVPIAAISKYQVSSIPPQRQRTIRVIYHGCDFSTYLFCPEQGRYLAFLGRMAPQKNPLGAIHIARRVGMPIVLAGAPRNRDEEVYFCDHIKPLLDGKSVSYLGQVSQEEKIAFLRGAAALISPLAWDEHFGLVMIEAMACGTPVVACRRGSVEEVVDYGITGYYAPTVEELPPLVAQACALDRAAVRQQAELRFRRQRVCDQYVEFYRDCMGKQSRRAQETACKPGRQR